MVFCLCGGLEFLLLIPGIAWLRRWMKRRKLRKLGRCEKECAKHCDKV